MTRGSLAGLLAISMVGGGLVAAPAAANSSSNSQTADSELAPSADQGQADEFANRTVEVVETNSPRVVAHVKAEDKNIRQGSDLRSLGVYFDKVIDADFPTPATRRYVLTFAPPEPGITFRPMSNSIWKCHIDENKKAICKTDRTTEWDKKKVPGEFKLPVVVSEDTHAGQIKFHAQVEYEQEEFDTQKQVVGWRPITNPAKDQATTAVTITPALRVQLESLVGPEFVAPAENDSKFGLRLGVENAEQQGALVTWRQLSGPKLQPTGHAKWRQDNVTEESILTLRVPKNLNLKQNRTVEFEATAADDGVTRKEKVSVTLARNHAAKAHDAVVDGHNQGSESTDGKVDREALKKEEEEQVEDSSGQSGDQPNNEPADEPTGEPTDAATNTPSSHEIPDHVVKRIDDMQAHDNELMYDLLKESAPPEMLGVLTSGGDEIVADQDMMTESDDVILRFTPDRPKPEGKVTATVKVKETPAGWGGVEIARVDWNFTNVEKPGDVVPVVRQQDFNPGWYKTALKDQTATAVFEASNKYEGQIQVTATVYLVDPTKRTDEAEPDAVATLVTERVTTMGAPDEDEYQLPQSNKKVSIPASQALCKLASDLSAEGAKKELDLRDGSKLTLVHTDAKNAKTACEGLWKSVADKSESTIASVNSEVAGLDTQIESAKAKLKLRESTGIDHSYLADEYKALADLEKQRTDALSEKEAAQNNLNTLGEQGLKDAKESKSSGDASNVKFNKATLSFAGTTFKNVTGEIQIGQGQIMIKELDLDAQANGSTWSGQLAAKLGKLRGKIPLKYNAKGEPTILKGEAKFGAGKDWIDGTVGGMNWLLQKVGLDETSLPFVSGEGGGIGDIKGVTFSFNMHADPTVTRSHLTEKEVPEEGVPGERAILGTAFNITPKPPKQATAVPSTKGEYELSAYYRAHDNQSQLVDGKLLINNLGPVDLGESAVLFNGSLTMTRAPKSEKVTKQIEQLKAEESRRFQEFTMHLRGGAELEKARKQIADLEASDTENVWGGSLGATCISKKLAVAAELVGGADDNGAAYMDRIAKEKTKVAVNPVCPLGDYVGLKDLKLEYLPSHAGQVKATPGATIDRTKGWFVQGQFVLWKPEDNASSATIEKSCSTSSLVKDAPATAADAKKIGCREITLAMKGQYEPSSNLLDLAVGASGKSRKTEKVNPDEKKEEIAKSKTREVKEIAPRSETESDTVADIGWGVKLTGINGEVVIDLNKDKAWKDRFAFEVAGKAKGFAGSDDISAEAGIGNLCEAKDAQENRCTKGSVNVTFDVQVPFDPIDIDDPTAKGKATKNTKLVTAQGMLQWSSKLFTIKGSYGNGSADLPGDIKLRDLGLTITNDPQEKPTVCVPDKELQAKFDAREVDVDASMVTVAKDKLKDLDDDLKTAQKQLAADKAALVVAQNDLAQAKANKAVSSTITSMERAVTTLQGAISKNESVIINLQSEQKLQQGAINRAQDQYDNSVKSANKVAKEREEAAKKSQLWIGLAATANIGSLSLNVQGRYIHQSRDLCMAIQGAKSISYDSQAGAWTSKPDTADNTASNPATAGNFGVSQWGIVYSSYPTIIQREILNAQTQNTAGPDGTTIPAAVLPPGSPLKEQVAYQNISVTPGLTVLGRVSAGDVVPEQIAGSMKKNQMIDALISIGDTPKYGTALTVKIDFALPQKSYLVGAQDVERERGTLGFAGFGGFITIGKTGFDLGLNAKADLTSPMLNEENKPDKSLSPSSRNLIAGITGTVTAKPAYFGIGLLVGLEESKSASQVVNAAANQGIKITQTSNTVERIVKSGDFGIPGLKIGSGSLSLSVSSVSPVPVVVADLSKVELPGSWTEKLALRDSSVSARLVVAPSGGGFGFSTSPLDTVKINKLGSQFDLASLGWVEASEIGLSVVTTPYQLPDPKDSTRMLDQPAGVGVVFAGRFFGTPLHATVRVSWGKKLALCTDLILPEMNLAGITFKGYDGRYETPEKRNEILQRAAKGTWSCDGKPAPSQPNYDQPNFAEPSASAMQAGQTSRPSQATGSASPTQTINNSMLRPLSGSGTQKPNAPVVVRLDIDPLAGRYNADIDATVEAGKEGIAYVNAGLKGGVRLGNADVGGGSSGSALKFNGGGLLQMASANLAEAKFNVDLAKKAGAWHGALAFSAKASVIAVELGVGGAAVIENNVLKAAGFRGKAAVLFWDGYVNAMYCDGEIKSVKYGATDIDAPLPTCDGKGYSFDKSVKFWFGDKQTQYPVTQESPSQKYGWVEYKLPVKDGLEVLKDEIARGAGIVESLGLFDKWGTPESVTNRKFMTHGTLNKETHEEYCTGMWWWKECKSFPKLQYRMSVSEPMSETWTPSWISGENYLDMIKKQKATKSPTWVDGVKNPEAFMDRPLAANNPCVVVNRSYVDKQNPRIYDPTRAAREANEGYHYGNTYIENGDATNMNVRDRNMVVAPRGALRTDLPQKPTCKAQVYVAVKNKAIGDSDNPAGFAYERIRPGIMTCTGKGGQDCDISFFDTNGDTYREARADSGLFSPDNNFVKELIENKKITSQ